MNDRTEILRELIDEFLKYCGYKFRPDTTPVYFYDTPKAGEVYNCVDEAYITVCIVGGRIHVGDNPEQWRDGTLSYSFETLQNFLEYVYDKMPKSEISPYRPPAFPQKLSFGHRLRGIKDLSSWNRFHYMKYFKELGEEKLRRSRQLRDEFLGSDVLDITSKQLNMTR